MTASTQSVVIPGRSRAFDGLITLCGALVTITFLVAQTQNLPPPEHLKHFAQILVIVVMCRFPLHFGRAGGVFEIGFEFGVLVLLGCIVAPVQAMTVWSLGVIIGQLAMRKRIRAKLFNAGIGVVAGTLALLVFLTVRSGELSQPRELLAAAVGGAVYFIVDYAVSGVSIALEERKSIRRQLAEPEVLPVLAAFLGITSLGYLAALVLRELPPWSTSLVAVPVATIMIAVRARARGIEQARRLQVLLDTSGAVQEPVDEESVLDALLAGGKDMLLDERVELRSTAPGQREIGALVEGTAEDVWIIAPVVARTGANSKDDAQGLGGLGVIVRDALARLKLSREMRHLAWHDALTGLPNRGLFLERLERSTLRQGRRTGRSAVLFCDLDGFKRVNDMFGHVAGDELLVEVARRITTCVREVDTVARLGGDEFAVLLEDVQDPGDIDVVCERILESLRARITVLNEDVSISVTIGLAMSDGGDTADLLLSRADMAMYRAKAKGKNRYETYHATFGDERLLRIAMVEKLRRAIDARELEIHYQAVVDLRNEQAYGVEALVRWRDNGKLVSPDLFIPTAEESGLIIELGTAVLELVTLDAPKLRAAAGRRIAVGLNVSAQQLQREQFPDEVLAARARMGDVDLVLEVTERDIVDSDPRTLEAMITIADADVRFAVDDFGTGFSSIGYLRRLPVRILKIDKSFLYKIEDDVRACSLVRSMVVMGDALGLDVVVEGVERLSQLEHLTGHAHATIGQGYLFGRPVPLDAMLALLSAEPTVVTWAPHPVDQGQARLAAGHRDHSITAADSEATGAASKSRLDPAELADLELAARLAG